jgi:hypothetical protein
MGRRADAVSGRCTGTRWSNFPAYTQLDQCVEIERIDRNGLLAHADIVQFSTKE